MQPDNATALPWEGQPCLGWGYHDRMGHNRTVGQFWAGPTPDTVWCQVPAVDGDGRHAALPEERHLLPIGGPAFYGFKANLDKEAALAARRDQRPYSHNAYGGHDYNEADRLLGLPPGPEPETYGSSPYADDAPLTADEAASARLLGVDATTDATPISLGDRVVRNEAPEEGAWAVVEADILDPGHVLIEPTGAAKGERTRVPAASLTRLSPPVVGRVGLHRGAKVLRHAVAGVWLVHGWGRPDTIGVFVVPADNVMAPPVLVLASSLMRLPGTNPTGLPYQEDDIPF